MKKSTPHRSRLDTLTRDWLARRDRARLRREAGAVPVYPTTVDGNVVWACCDSRIGPTCAHKKTPRDIETVADLLAALDARGDDVSAAAAYLIRTVAAQHPEVLDVDNAEL